MAGRVHVGGQLRNTYRSRDSSQLITFRRQRRKEEGRKEGAREEERKIERRREDKRHTIVSSHGYSLCYNYLCLLVPDWVHAAIP